MTFFQRAWSLFLYGTIVLLYHFLLLAHVYSSACLARETRDGWKERSLLIGPNLGEGQASLSTSPTLVSREMTPNYTTTVKARIAGHDMVSQNFEDSCSKTWSFFVFYHGRVTSSLPQGYLPVPRHDTTKYTLKTQTNRHTTYSPTITNQVTGFQHQFFSLISDHLPPPSILSSAHTLPQLTFTSSHPSRG